MARTKMTAKTSTGGKAPPKLTDPCPGCKMANCACSKSSKTESGRDYMRNVGKPVGQPK